MSADNDPGKKSDAELQAERGKVAEELRTERDPGKKEKLQARYDELGKEQSARAPAAGKGEHNEIRRESSHEFEADGNRYRVETSEMTYDRENMKNARATPEGRSADQKARQGVFSETGRDAAHAHSLSGNADPSDRGNITPGNSMQNRSGGAKAQIERERDQAIGSGSATSVNEKSSRIYARDRPGYGDHTPIAEEVTHTYRNADGTSSSRTLTLGNFPSSTSRYAEAQAAKGEKTDPKEMERLYQQDKEHFREQGHGTVNQGQQHVRDLKAREDAGEKVQWGPRLAVDNTQREKAPDGPPPRPKSASKSAGPPPRNSPSEPDLPDRGRERSR